MFKKFLLGCLAILLIIGGTNMANANFLEKGWDKTFPKSDKVTVQKVKFKNRFGITLVGDLYTSTKSINQGDKLPAIAISGPFGAVKEQSSGLYAQTLAERGFVTLAFDPSYTGESSGTPRHIASPDINTEDFSAAVDYLSNLDIVNPDKIGILGICGFGGFAINAAAIDTRIKATTAITMYDMTRVSARGYNDSVDENARYEMKQTLNKQRTEDYKNGTFAKADGLPEKLTGNEPQFVKDYWGYYKTKRGFHARSINSNGKWNMTSSLSLINQPILQYSDEIRSAVLVVHGENAHSRYFGEDAYKKLKGDNKELLIVKGANHVDLYDGGDKNAIPFDKIESFYKENLK
ncbi:alpha/beta hydrolase [bacterium]|nr:alpha/beta hydrolase [bacterium]